ncbi:MAG: DUF362 domain-containing protein, partial [Promethearchaeota archaeon]
SIQPGSRVFVLCNIVYQRRPNERLFYFMGKCTHGSVLRALIDYILIATGNKGKVQFGNAPLQSANWESVLSDTGADLVARFYQERGLAVEACDLRLFVAERSRAGKIKQVEYRDKKEGIQIDLGSISMLAEFDKIDAHFRVLDYDPRRTEKFHGAGRYIYIIHRKILESDVIFSVPNLKTHEEIGITCAIKGCVGAVGDKDCLAHHRFGPPQNGGDEYPSDIFWIKKAFSTLHDIIQKLPLNKRYGQWMRCFESLLRRIIRRVMGISGGAWYGNDTCWRMAVDLARILRYADVNGIMYKRPIRNHLALIDGIIGGEGEGPLRPKSVKSGILAFTDNILSSDWVAAILMGFDPYKLPLLTKTRSLRQYPVSLNDLWDEEVIYNSEKTNFTELMKIISYHYSPPHGWRGYL